MGAFVGAALSFPAVLFTFCLLVVIGYWLLVALGASDVDGLDSTVDGTGLGFGGVPVSIAVTLVIAIGWFAALVATVLLQDVSGPLHVVLGLSGLLVALVFAMLITRVIVVPLRRAFPEASGASRTDFVGRVCVIRTGRVDETFGQAEVTAEDGSSAVVQVRQAGSDPLRAGSAALIYDYDQTGEFFWVSPVETT